LFHSGYHFVDLCSQLMHLNFLIEDKKPNRVCTTSSHYSPKDQMFSLDETVLEQLFFSDHYTEYYHKWKEGSFDKMGELDVYALIEFFKDEHLLTVCNLNLLQSGFSKRAWSHLPKDTYKGNGRVRHEMLNLHLGPLMNIQVHSYQAHEIKERTNKNIDHNAIGGLEHFDIYIFRNCELIGGKPLEIIKSSDIYCKNQSEQTDFLGFNESARHDLLSDFLFQKQSLSDLFSHQLTIELIHELYKTILLKRHALAPFSELSLKDFDDTTQLHRRLLVR